MTSKPKKRQLKKRTQVIVAIPGALLFGYVAGRLGLGGAGGELFGGLGALLAILTATWIMRGQPEPSAAPPAP